MKFKFLQTGLALTMALGIGTFAQALPADFYDKLSADSRPEADKARDATRRPGQVMTLLGVEEGMTVVDVAAGGGWYTRVISAAVGPSGKVVSQVGPRGLQNNNGQAAKDLAASLGNVEPFFGDMAEVPSGTVDRAITALNFHDAYNFRGEEGAQGFLKGIFDALKSGGVAAIIDHEGSMGMDNGNLHRLPAATARTLIEQAGFVGVTESDLLHTNADDHSASVRDPALARNTDRFVFIARKP